jgi:hypothetical protein
MYVLFCLGAVVVLACTHGPQLVLNSRVLTECQSISLVVSSLNNDDETFGTPPYYMMALEIDGVPTTDVVGEDPTMLSWVVNHAAGK